MNGDKFQFHSYDVYFQKTVIAQRKRTTAGGEEDLWGAQSRNAPRFEKSFKSYRVNAEEESRKQ